MTTVRRKGLTQSTNPIDLASELRGEGHRVGPTRVAIMEAVERRTEVFSAEDLASELQGIHLATIYRTLGLLEEVGVVRHVHLSHGPAVYERTVSAPVRHLVCDVCERSFTVPAKIFASASKVLERDYDFVLGGGHFAIVGRCRSCVED